MPTYPPPPCLAHLMDVPGNPLCHCLDPMAAMFCLEGHMLECHAGMTCAEAHCGHYEHLSEDGAHARPEEEAS